MEALNEILGASQKRGLVYITDADGRPSSGASACASVGHGADPADELNRILAVREAALARFGENVIKTGTRMAPLEETMLPLYLLHRYKTEAEIKEIGGLDYRYALRGDGQLVTEIVDPTQQNKALKAVLETLTPETLTLPESLLKILPLMPGDDESRWFPAVEKESFKSQTGVTFDPLARRRARRT